MDQEQEVIRKSSPAKKLIIVCLVTVVLIGTAFTIYPKYRGIVSEKFGIGIEGHGNKGGEENEKKKLEIKKLEDVYDKNDIGTISSSLGFSIKYPYKLIQPMGGDDGKFQVAFMYYPEELFTNEDIAEKIDIVGDNYGVKSALALTVSEEPKEGDDVALWMKNYLKDKNSSKREGMQVISSKTEDIVISGMPGKMVVQEIKTTYNQKEIRNVYKDIFVFKEGLTYHFEQVLLPENFQFPGGSEELFKYFERGNTIFAQIVGSFNFDDSRVTSISIPKKQQPELSGEAKMRREQLLAALRTPPFFDEKQANPEMSNDERCETGSTMLKDTNAYKSDLRPSPGMTMRMDSDVAQIHGYDSEGRHSGPMPMVPALESEYGSIKEEGSWGMNIMDFVGEKYYLIISENMDGRVEVVGKDYSSGIFRINGDGNRCLISETILPITPYSVCTLPITINGDTGPFSCDMDGDGIEDFKMSLIHPLTEEKYAQLAAVLEDMKNNE